MTMIDPIMLGQGQQKTHSPYLHNLDILVRELQKISGARDGRLSTASQSVYDFPHCYYYANENIAAYPKERLPNWI